MAQRARESISKTDLARIANEQMIRARIVSAAAEEELLALACECSRPKCEESVAATAAEYNAIRSDPGFWLVAVGHCADSKQAVIHTPRYWVVKPAARRTATRRAAQT